MISVWPTSVFFCFSQFETTNSSQANHSWKNCQDSPPPSKTPPANPGFELPVAATRPLSPPQRRLCTSPQGAVGQAMLETLLAKWNERYCEYDVFMTKKRWFWKLFENNSNNIAIECYCDYQNRQIERTWLKIHSRIALGCKLQFAYIGYLFWYYGYECNSLI